LSLNTLLLINFIDLHLQEISAIILLANINITGLQKLRRQLYSDDPIGPSVQFAAVCYVRKCGYGQVKHE